MSMPGFNAEVSLVPTASHYASTPASFGGGTGPDSGIVASFITHGCNFQCGFLCLRLSGSWCCCLPVFPKVSADLISEFAG